jgi:hypothetical protein
MGGNIVLLTRVKKAQEMKITASMVGTTADLHDDQDNTYTPLAYEYGYRLRCGKFPGKFTIQIVFASVAPPPDLIAPLAGPRGMRSQEISGLKSDFDILAPKPSPLQVSTNGKYLRIMKPYYINETVLVNRGN